MMEFTPREQHAVLRAVAAALPPAERMQVEMAAARLEEMPGVGEQGALEMVYALGRLLFEGPPARRRFENGYGAVEKARRARRGRA